MYLLEDAEGNEYTEEELYKMNTPKVILPVNTANAFGAYNKEVNNNG